MRTRVALEPAAFVLEGYTPWDRDNRVDRVTVTWSDLRSAEVGKRWRASNPSNVVRDVREEEAVVVYRDASGVAVLHRVVESGIDGTSASEESVELVWYEFADVDVGVD